MTNPSKYGDKLFMTKKRTCLVIFYHPIFKCLRIFNTSFQTIRQSGQSFNNKI